MQRERPHRLSNVLEFDWAEIGRRDIAPPLHEPIRLLGQADASWLANAFETRRDIDAIAHQIAVGFLGHVAKVNADAEDDLARAVPALRSAMPFCASTAQRTA